MGLTGPPMRVLAAAPMEAFVLGVGIVVGLPKSPSGLLKILVGRGDLTGVFKID